MSRPLALPLISAALLLLAGCGRGLPADLEPLAIESPAGPESGEPNLSLDEDGRVLLSWLEPAGDAHRLRMSWLDPDSSVWAVPRTVATGDDWFVNWADFPSIVPLDSDGGLAAHWLARTGSGAYAYAVNIAFSRDMGRTWTDPVVPHGDDTQTEHGFVSLVPAGDGRVSVFWLDGRAMAETGDGDMALRHAVVGPEGRSGAESVLDERVCECCQTSAARTADGLVVVYRDRSSEEVRDIGIVGRRDGDWEAPRPLSSEGWRIEACPVNGPSISASGREVAAAWFTAEPEPAVWIAFSEDGGRGFGSPVRVDDGNPLGRVEVVRIDEAAYVAWMEQTAAAAVVRLRQVYSDGTAGRAWDVTATSESRSSGFPQLAGDRDRLVLAWTEAGRPMRVRTAVLSLDGRS